MTRRDLIRSAAGLVAGFAAGTREPFVFGAPEGDVGYQVVEPITLTVHLDERVIARHLVQHLPRELKTVRV